MGHHTLRKIAHINPGSAQGAEEPLRSSEPGGKKWLQLTAARTYRGARNELQT